MVNKVYHVILIVICLLDSWRPCRGNVGPVCLHCPRTDNPALCRNTVACPANEVCADLSSKQQSTAIIGKRQVSLSNQRCVYCCSTDFCNVNCTSFVNLALHRPAYQSSVYWKGTADLAVDGDVTKNFFHGSCTHDVSTELYPWWAVDLQNSYTITKVKIHERDDAYDDRVFRLSVLVSEHNATRLLRNSTLFSNCGGYYGHSSDGDVITVDCPLATKGRWVRIQALDDPATPFHLCEVEVFGY